jgi:hypothetical protein
MSQFCVIEGTKITLKNKETIPIETLKVGQEILSFNLNTLQKSQKNDTLLKLSTDKFDGVFQEDFIKNIWKNEAGKYYSINNKLKITGDHIVLGKRENIFYWTTVDKLRIGDYLFTDKNIFVKINHIILIKEKVKVYNLQVNDVYNYFANSYLIHNGAPCSACTACGISGYTLTILMTTSNFASGETDSNKTITIGSDTQTFAQVGDVTNESLVFSGLSGTSHQLTFGFSQSSWSVVANTFVGAVNGINNFGSGTTANVSLSSAVDGGLTITIES